MKITLQLSCYNGGRYLPYLFASLECQTMYDWHLHVLDNASDEENSRLIREAVAASSISLSLDRVERNIGFANAHNRLFTMRPVHTDYVLLLNDDAILEPNFIKQLVAYLDTNPSCASVSGQILRWDFSRCKKTNKGKTDIVDSLGLAVGLHGFVRDVGAGQRLTKTYISSSPTPIFGPSGCLPVYRISAVLASSPDGALFDTAYGSYKEDVELAYRLRAAGFTSMLVPDAIAYHRRTFRTNEVNRSEQQYAYPSFRNHLWMDIVHLPIGSLVTNRCLVIPAELAKIVYWIAKRPSFIVRLFQDTFTHWADLIRLRKHAKYLRTHRGTFTAPYPKPNADVNIIIVSHNELSIKTLQSLQTAREHFSGISTVVVVDNASIDYRANELIATVIPDAWVLLRNGDYGYGRSMNMGADWIDAKAYFILNPDTILDDPEILNQLWAYLNTHPDVGLVGPKLLGFDGVLQDTCRRFPSWYQPFIQRTSLRQTAFGKRYIQYFLMKDADRSRDLDADWIQGSAMFIRGNLWKSLHGFDDRYWLYFEDIDLCRRVWQSGNRVVCTVNTQLRHAHGHQSAKIKNTLINILKTKETRSHLMSWQKYLRKWKFISHPRSH